MRIGMLLFLMGIGFAQTRDDAAGLIQAVADSAADTTNWRIEGTIEYSGSNPGDKATEQFKILQSPDKTRFEQAGDRAPAVIVCNGADAWIYSPPLRRYRKEPSDGNKLCSPFVGDWKRLPITIQSPKVAGACGPNPKVKAPGYRLVRGFFEPEIASAGRITRTLCIDEDRKLIVWEKWASRYGSRVYTYLRIDHPVGFPASDFAFDPPPGSIATDLDLPAPRPLGTSAMPHGPEISVPRLVFEKEPTYGPESRAARLQGTVVLYVVIGTNGAPLEVLVYRPLGPDLDAQAVNAVRQWRFKPATKNGSPIALAVEIEVNFQLR
jgi:TonB family protein